MTNNEMLLGDLKYIKQKCLKQIEELELDIQKLKEEKEEIKNELPNVRFHTKLQSQNKKLKKELDGIHKEYGRRLSVLQNQIDDDNTEAKSNTITTEINDEDIILEHIRQSKEFEGIPKDVDLNLLHFGFTVDKRKPLVEIIKTAEGITGNIYE